MSNFLETEFAKHVGIAAGIAEKSKERRLTLRATMNGDLGFQTIQHGLAPMITLEKRLIVKLRPATRQVRRSIMRHNAEVAASMQQFGNVCPILITPDGMVIDGHARLEAAKSLGQTDIQCLVIAHLNATNIRRLSIALNRLQEKGEWDFPAFEAEIKELNVELGGDLTIPGIELSVLDAVLQEQIQPQEKIDPGLLKRPLIPITHKDDVWKVGPHIIACADARDSAFATRLLQQYFSVPGVRLNCSDLPYNVRIKGHVTSSDHREFLMAAGEMSDAEFKTFLVESLKAISMTMMDGGLTMAFMDWRSIKLLLIAADEVGLDLINIVVWGKSNAGMGSLYRSQHEFIVVLKKGSAPHINNVELGKHGRYRSNLWSYPGASSLGSDARQHLSDHPTPKPVVLLEDAILDVTERGDLVFDSFSGSGSTLIAADKTGRLFCGTELDPGYCDVILRRWLDHSALEPVLSETDETMSEVIARRSTETIPDPKAISKPDDDNSDVAGQEV